MEYSTNELLKIKQQNAEKVEKAFIQQAPINPGMPLMIHCIDSTSCNLKCIMCEWHRNEKVRNEKQAQKVWMDEKFLKPLFNGVFPTLITFAPTKMGEPLLSPNLSLMMEYSKKFGVKWEINTNATLLHGSLNSKILPLCSKIIISLDSHIPKIAENIRQGLDFPKLIENIKELLRMRKIMKDSMVDFRAPQIIIHSVLVRKNIEYLADFVEFSQNLGVDGFEAYHIYVFDQDFADQSLMYYPELANVNLQKAKQKARELGFKTTLTREFWLDEGEPPTPTIHPCPWLWKYALIDYDHTVRACPVPKHPIMGNLDTHSFEQIWNNKMYQEFRRRVNSSDPPEICRNCGDRIHYSGDIAIKYEKERFLKA